MKGKQQKAKQPSKAKIVMHRLMGEHDWTAKDINGGFKVVCSVCGEENDTSERLAQYASLTGTTYTYTGAPAGTNIWSTTTTGTTSSLTMSGINAAYDSLWSDQYITTSYLVSPNQAYLIGNLEARSEKYCGMMSWDDEKDR